MPEQLYDLRDVLETQGKMHWFISSCTSIPMFTSTISSNVKTFFLMNWSLLNVVPFTKRNALYGVLMAGSDETGDNYFSFSLKPLVKILSINNDFGLISVEYTQHVVRHNSHYSLYIIPWKIKQKENTVYGITILLVTSVTLLLYRLKSTVVCSFKSVFWEADRVICKNICSL